MIGLSGVIGNINPDYDYNKKFYNIHAVNGISMYSYEFSDNTSAFSLIGRKEIFEDSGKDCHYEDEDFLIIIDGYINDYNSNNKNFNHAHYFLNLWKEKKETFIKDLNGEYNICIYSKKEKELILFNDRFASRNFFYLYKSGNFYFGSEIKAILIVIPEMQKISEEGLIEFFLFSHNIGDKTLFENLNALEPSTIIKFKNGRIEKRKYWDLYFDRKKIDPKKITGEMFDILKKAGEERCSEKNKIGMGLSGGLDSRVIASAIPKKIRPVYARTFGDENSIEVKAAKEIAKRLNFEHHIHTPRKILYSDFLYPSVWRTECSVHFVGLKSIIEHKNLKDKIFYNLGGQFGDVLTGKQLRPFMFMPQKKDKFINQIFDYYISYTYKSEDKIKKIFNPVFFENNFNAAKENFINSLSSVNADSNADLYDAWDLKNRQSRFTFSSGRVDNYIYQKIKLFTDYDYVELMLKVPPSQRFGQNLYKQMIASQLKDVNDIINANTGQTVKSSFFGNLLDLFYQYKMLKKKNNKPIKKENRQDLLKKDFKLKEILLSFTKNSSFPADIFSKEGIEGVTEEHYSGRKNNEYILGVLATFAAAFDLFILNRNYSIPEKAEPFNI